MNKEKLFYGHLCERITNRFKIFYIKKISCRSNIRTSNIQSNSCVPVILWKTTA